MQIRIIPFLFLSFVLFTSAVSAQDSHMLFGGGLNLSKFSRKGPSGVHFYDQNFLTGFNALIGYQTSGDEVGVTVIGIGFETRGTELKDETPSGNAFEEKTRLDYLHFAFAFKYFITESAVKPYASPGLDIAFLTNAEIEDEDGVRDFPQTSTLDLDLGLALGAEIPFGRHAVFLEGGYAYGLFNALEGDIAKDFTFHNSCIKLRGGFLLGI